MFENSNIKPIPKFLITSDNLKFWNETNIWFYIWIGTEMFVSDLIRTKSPLVETSFLTTPFCNGVVKASQMKQRCWYHNGFRHNYGFYSMVHLLCAEENNSLICNFDSYSDGIGWSHLNLSKTYKYNRLQTFNRE